MTGLKPRCGGCWGAYENRGRQLTGASCPTRIAGMLFSPPNLVTLFRILLVGALVATFYFDGDWARWAACGLFAVAAISDLLDGWLARVLKAQTEFGRMLDPIADKLLIAIALLLLVGLGSIGGVSIIAAAIILAREILVSGLREHLAELRVKVPVSRLAKWKTAAQLLAVGVLLSWPAGEAVFGWIRELGLLLLWCAALLTVHTGWAYLRATARHVI